jgi:hypothetical protein
LRAAIQDPGADHALERAWLAVLDIRRPATAPLGTFGAIVDLDDTNLLLRALEVERSPRLKLLAGCTTPNDGQGNEANQKSIHFISKREFLALVSRAPSFAKNTDHMGRVETDG